MVDLVGIDVFLSDIATISPRHNNLGYNQGSGVGGYTPLAGKILNIPPLRILEKYTPPPSAALRAAAIFFGQNSKIRVQIDRRYFGGK